MRSEHAGEPVDEQHEPRDQEVEQEQRAADADEERTTKGVALTAPDGERA